MKAEWFFYNLLSCLETVEWFCRLQSKTLLDLQAELLVVLAEAPPGGDWWDLQSRQPILTLIHSEVKGAF